MTPAELNKPNEFQADVIVFGGGIAGLWLLNRLRQEGYGAILLEAHALGGGQTLASQGIIHGGLKYALGGVLSGATQAIADMPQHWRACLRGEADVDLQGCRVLSDHYYMWSEGGLFSKFKTFLGSRSLRGRVEPVAPASYPRFFQAATVAGNLYQLPDFVVDTESVLNVLWQQQKDCIYKVDNETISIDAAPDRDPCVHIAGKTPIQLRAKRLIFCAGEGNQALAQSAGLSSVSSQNRPLHMVYLSSPSLEDLFVHCIGSDFGLIPQLTVTTHRDDAGSPTWYLGGELAESGVERTESQQIDMARSLLARQFPWIDIGDAEWGSLMINRAEAGQGSRVRPDDVSFVQENRIITAWPTKLTLSPSLADKLLKQLETDRVLPSDKPDQPALVDLLPKPTLANVCWNSNGG